jgi:hypothetical protein
MTEIKLTLDDPAQTVELLHNAARHAGGTGWDHKSAQHTDWLARQITAAIEQQATPAIDEPTEFGSMVRAPWSGKDILWVRWLHSSWLSETGVTTAWSQLHNPEVLRVGIGEPVADQDSFSRGVLEGQRYVCIQATVGLGQLLADAITAERKGGLQRAIELIERLQP